MTEQERADKTRGLKKFRDLLTVEVEKLGLGPNVLVVVAADPTHSYFRKPSDAPVLVSRVTRIVADRASQLAERSPIALYGGLIAPYDLPGITEIRIARVAQRLGASVDLILPSWCDISGPTLRAVREKDPKARKYKEANKLDRVWLLLVTGSNPEQTTDSDLVDGQTAASSFDAVFLLDLRLGQVRRLHGSFD